MENCWGVGYGAVCCYSVQTNENTLPAQEVQR